MFGGGGVTFGALAVSKTHDDDLTFKNEKEEKVCKWDKQAKLGQKEFEHFGGDGGGSLISS